MLELQGIQNIITIFMNLVAKLYKNLRCSFKAGVGSLRPAKPNYPPRSPFTNCSNYMARLVVLYFMSLSPCNILCCILMRDRTGLLMYFMSFFPTFVTNSENQELIWLKLHNLPSCISNFINSEGNGIVGRKLVRPPDLAALYKAYLACQSFQRRIFAMVLKWNLHHHQLGYSKLVRQKQLRNRYPFTFGWWLQAHIYKFVFHYHHFHTELKPHVKVSHGMNSPAFTLYTMFD